MASDYRPVDARRPPRSRRPCASGVGGAIAMAAVAAAATACTQTHVVLEPAPDADAGPGDTGPGTTVLAISTGDMHTCAIAQGALYCWGANDDGRLGVAEGDRTRHLLPTRVGTEANWQAVATGNTSTLALKTDGTMWSFGGNDLGQLGLGDLTSRTTPRRIGERADWKAIATRFKHACALARDGSLWCWGENDEGQLGQNDAAPPKHYCDPPSSDSICRAVDPIRVRTTPPHDFVAVDAGEGHTCAIATDGTLWCWGRNSDSELGQEGENAAIVQIRRPVKVRTATDWKLVRGGQNTTCGVRAGAAYCWGESVSDKEVAGVDMGIPGVSPRTTVSTPTYIGVPRVVDLSFNTFGGAVLDDNDGAWVWGRNREGQLGQGDLAEYPDVVPAKEPGWTQVSVGRFTTCGVRGSQLVCAGKNDVGQLGQDNMSDSPTFLVVTLPPQ